MEQQPAREGELARLSTGAARAQTDGIGDEYAKAFEGWQNARVGGKAQAARRIHPRMAQIERYIAFASTHGTDYRMGGSDIIRAMARTKTKDETIQLKKHQLYAAFIPVAFLFGIGAGFLLWGRGAAAPETAALVPTAVGVVQATGQASDTTDLASQMENLPRYDVPVEADDPTLGPEDAPITIIEFADFQCPFCQRHALETHAQLIEAYGDQIRFVYKDFPLTSIHPEAYSSALAAACAEEQGQFWEYHDLLYSGTMELGPDTYSAYAEQLGLDMAEFNACYDEERYAEQVQADYGFGAELGVSSTPTFFVNGIAVVGAQPFSLFAEIIDYELENSQ
jgi:protein-disulfide isomerase